MNDVIIRSQGITNRLLEVLRIRFLRLERMKEFFNSTTAKIGVLVFGLVVVMALTAPLIAPQNPYELSTLNIEDSVLPPGSVGLDGTRFLLGSDGQGRDMLSAIMYGLRISLAVGVTSTGFAFLVGAIVGLVASYFGGRLESVIMRIVDIQLSFPSLLIALVLVSVFGPGTSKIIIALIIIQWAYFARTIRGVAVSELQKEYIVAAECVGLGSLRIIFGHLLPNCLPLMVVVVMISVANAIALEATLSFLGVGLPVTEPSLGMLVSNGYKWLLSGRYWISVYPGIALFITVASINLLGDRLRDVLNPRLEK